MNISIDLFERDSVIKKRMLEALVTEVNIALSSSRQVIEREIRSRASSWLSSSPEIESLVSGTLRADFGLPDSMAAVAGASIVMSILETLHIELISISTVAFKGGLLIRMQPGDFSNLLSLPAGRFLSAKGEKIDWLNWLLTRGDDIVVADYHVEYGSYGRTGEARMVKGNAFRVNPSFSGTLYDNFVHRAFVGKEAEIAAIIKKFLKT